MTLPYECVHGSEDISHQEKGSNGSRRWGGKISQSETFPLHLALLMIFSANSFPVDLSRNSAIRANNKNSTDTATMSVKQIKCSQESHSYSEQEQHRRVIGKVSQLY